MSDKEILERFEDWLESEVEWINRVMDDTGAQREIWEVFRKFFEIKNEGRSKENHEENVECGS